MLKLSEQYDLYVAIDSYLRMSFEGDLLLFARESIYGLKKSRHFRAYPNIGWFMDRRAATLLNSHHSTVSGFAVGAVVLKLKQINN